MGLFNVSIKLKLKTTPDLLWSRIDLSVQILSAREEARGRGGGDGED